MIIFGINHNLLKITTDDAHNQFHGIDTKLGVQQCI